MNMLGRNGIPARVRNACACGLIMCLPTIFSGNSYALGCDSGGFVTVTASVSSIAESGGGTAQFIFAVTAPAGADAHLTLQITGTASNGVDYQTLPTQLTLPANQSRVTLTLRPIPDSVPEGTEGVTVTIAASDNICILVGSPNSATISIVDPTGPPGPPTGVTATAGNAQASLSFTPPINNGGSAIIGYAVTSSPAGGIDGDAGTTTTTRTISALTNGTSYTFTVTATNGIATSVPSAPSNSVIPATTPSAPLAVTALAGNALATVSFAAPASDGGSAITGFTVTSSPAGGVDSKAGTIAMMHTITGLTNGTPYTFTVIATNTIGPGSPSAASNIVTPDVGLPPIPTDIVTRKVHGGAGTFDLPLSP